MSRLPGAARNASAKHSGGVGPFSIIEDFEPRTRIVGLKLVTLLPFPVGKLGVRMYAVRRMTRRTMLRSGLGGCLMAPLSIGYGSGMENLSH